jgi:hypothetical protein
MSVALPPYKPGRKIYQLVFEDFPGMEVHVSAMSLGELFDSETTTSDISKLSAKDLQTRLQLLADHIVVWNLVHPDIPKNAEVCPRCGLAAEMPLPTAVTYMTCLDNEIIMAILWGWISRISQVAGPKGGNLPPGNNEMMSEMMRRLGELQNQLTLPVPNFS